MKNINKLILGLGIASLFTACADDDIAYISVVKPEGLETYSYLDRYNVLKSYAKENTQGVGANFKLGAALSAPDYNNMTTLYALANSNFDEVVAGNAMKFASCVSADGVMDFSTVESFVDAASEAGTTIFGHTLAWHSQQQPKWLNSLIESKGGSGSGTVEKKDPMLFEVDFNKDETLAGNGVSFYQYVDEGPDGSRCFKLDCPSVGAANDWDAQIQIGADFEAGVKYAVEFDVKGTESGDRGMSHEGIDSPNYGAGGYSITTDWSHVTILYTTGAAGGRFHFNLGKFPGTIWIDNIKIYNKDLYDQQQPVEVEDVLYTFDDDVNFVGNGAGFFQIAAEGPNGSKCFKLDCPSVGAKDAWDAQLQVGYEFVEGTEYIVSMKVKGTASASLGMSHEGIDNPNWGAANFDVTTEWSNVRYTYKPAANGGKFQFNLGKYEGTIWIDDFKISHMEEPIFSVPSEEITLVNEAVVYNFDDDVNFVGNGASFFQIVSEGPDGSKCFKLDCPSVGATNDWDAQLQVGFDFVSGTAYTVSMKVKGTEEDNRGMSHEGVDPANYGAGGYKVTTDWSDVSIKYTPAADGGRFQFNLGKYPGTIWIDDFKITYETTEVIGGVELTPEEKKDTLTWALNRFITGMMKATNGKVKSWDLVNEAVGGADTDGNGFYNLQSAATIPADKKDEDAANNFYWQDYLGDIDYVVIAEKAARKAYSEIPGTNPDDLKLFVNDYNLEQTWGNLDKVKAYASYWIPAWEKAGAKIDGFGTQMHVSYHADAAQQKRQEECIVEMFKIMAKTGKLIRVSELDMCYVDVNGKELDGTLTYEQEQQMAGFYNFIVRAYLENIPADQQYGITVWCITDAPAEQSWRHKTISSLWSTEYYRKPAYAGVAEALQGKTYTAVPEAK